MQYHPPKASSRYRPDSIYKAATAQRLKPWQEKVATLLAYNLSYEATLRVAGARSTGCGRRCRCRRGWQMQSPCWRSEEACSGGGRAAAEAAAGVPEFDMAARRGMLQGPGRAAAAPSVRAAASTAAAVSAVACGVVWLMRGWCAVSGAGKCHSPSSSCRDAAALR